MTDARGAGMTPDSIMAFLASKLAKPTPLAKLRPQFGSTLLAVVVATLMIICPYLCFLWHTACTLSRFFPTIDIPKLKATLYSYFLRLAIFFFVRAPGLKVHLYGDAKDVMLRDENVLYMSNHQSSLDWLLACILALHANCLERMRFIMKQELHWVPMIGYYIKVCGHIYVRRKGFKPDRLLEVIDGYKEKKTPIWLGIFPEGTRFNPDDLQAISAAQEFARNNNKPLLEHQLTPRPRGSWLLVKNMRELLKAVYSVTLVYEQPEARGQRRRAPSATDVLRGQCTDVHVHVRRIPIEDVPTDEAAFQDWLNDAFVARDKLLSEYYSSRSFSSWGPSIDECPESTSRYLPDLSYVVLMLLGLILAPFVRTLYVITALVATLCGYLALALWPPF